MLIATLAALLAGLTVAGRIDVRQKVLQPPPAEGAASADTSNAKPDEPAMSERELEEALVKARTVEQVTRALAAVALPAELTLLALALYLLGRYVGGKPTFRRAVALASQAALPGAVGSLLIALAASRRTSIAPSELSALLLPSWHGIDPFAVWSVVLLTLGFPTLAGVSRTKSWISIGICFALWLALTRFVFGGAK